jgi:hypothetical protein
MSNITYINELKNLTSRIGWLTVYRITRVYCYEKRNDRVVLSVSLVGISTMEKYTISIPSPIFIL